MEPTFEGNVTLEHLQGYLYAQQALYNFMSPSGGSMNEYSIVKLERKEGESIRQLAARTIVEKIQYNLSNPAQTTSFLEKHIQIKRIPDWSNVLKTTVQKWFIDPFLSAEVCVTAGAKHIKAQKTWTAEQRKKQFEENVARQKRIDKQVREYQPSGTYFQYLLSALTDYDETDVWRLEISSIPKESYASYPASGMYYYWGITYEIYFLKTSQQVYMLHLGQLLT